MINLSHFDINNFEFIGYGGFGDIYKHGKYIYKIYRKDVEIFNPSLIYRPFKFRKLISVDGEIKYTDLIKDIVCVDGKFAGVVVPFYDGDTLLKLCDMELKKKLDVSQEIIRNSKELTSYFIYPLDYKLDNIMYVNGSIKLIDLDDCLTSVCMFPHNHLLKQSVRSLDATIKAFLGEYIGHVAIPELRSLIDKNVSFSNNTYNQLEDYLKEKSTINNYIFISNNSDLFGNIRLLRSCDYRVVYFSNNYCFTEDLLDQIIYMKNMGISIYDVIPYMNIDFYLRNKLYDDVLEICGDKCIKKILH